MAGQSKGKMKILDRISAPQKKHPQSGVFMMVGATGFEPATSCSRSKRSTKLSYAPSDVQAARLVLNRASSIIAFLCGESGRSRSEEHTSELQSLMRISYAVFR